MTYHDEYVELISAAIDGALSPAEQARLEEHLNTCPECKSLYDDLRTIHRTLLELPPVEVPARLTDRILEAVAADNITALPKPKKTVSPWKRTLAAAAVFALILLGAGTLRGQLSATKSVVPESLMAESPDNESKEPGPKMTSGDSENAASGEPQAPAQGYREVSAPANQMTDTVAPAEDTPAVQSEASPEMPAQGAAKQSPTSTPADQPDEEATDTQNTETFPIGDISAFMGGDTAPETTIDVTGSLFVLPVSEGVDMELPTERAPEEQDEEPGGILSFTREEALALVAERCFGNSGYQMVRENPEGEPLSCHVSLMDNDTFILGGTIVYTGENETYFLFECHWDDDPDDPYHYSVHKTEGYVAWQGEVLGNEP